VVARDIGDFDIVVGNTARKIGERFDSKTKARLKELASWSLAPAMLTSILDICTQPLSSRLLDLVGAEAQAGRASKFGRFQLMP
jgi:hypothetical protein